MLSTAVGRELLCSHEYCAPYFLPTAPQRSQKNKRKKTSLFIVGFFFFNIFIYLFLAVLGLCCCAWAFSGCGEQGLLFVAVCRLLTVVASLVAEHRL